MEETTKGQPLKLQKPGVKEKILTALAKGATYTLACGYAGIAYQTFRDWMKKGEPLAHLFEEQIEFHPDRIYYEFYCDVKRVESYAALKWLEKIDNAADVHWQAAAWKLERRHPSEYGRVNNDVKDDSVDSSLEKARSEVTKLKGDDHGRSTSTPG
jgi:transposase